MNLGDLLVSTRVHLRFKVCSKVCPYCYDFEPCRRVHELPSMNASQKMARVDYEVVLQKYRGMDTHREPVWARRGLSVRGVAASLFATASTIHLLVLFQCQFSLHPLLSLSLSLSFFLSFFLFIYINTTLTTVNCIIRLLASSTSTC